MIVMSLPKVQCNTSMLLSVSSADRTSSCAAAAASGSQLDLSKKSSSSAQGGTTSGGASQSVRAHYDSVDRHYGISSAEDVDDEDDERQSAMTDLGADRSDVDDDSASPGKQ
jgi:hypothetical protein